MSTGINKVILIGNLGQDPDTKYTANGDAMTTLSLATTETWKDKATGEPKSNTDWHRITLFKKLAETAAEFLKKGSKIYVEGRIRYRKYQDDTGKVNYRTEIHCEHIQFLDTRQKDDVPHVGTNNSSFGSYTRDAHLNATKPAPIEIDGAYDDDIPF